MEYRILGPLEVLNDGVPVDVGSRQQRALVAMLLLNLNRVVPTERILDQFWPDDPDGKERTLWVYVSRLRAALEPDREAHGENTVLVTRNHGYSLMAEPTDLDAHRFEEAVAHARSMAPNDPAAAVAEFTDALSMWRGNALEDFAYEEFAQLDAARLEELRLTAMEDRIEAQLRLGRHREAIAEIDGLVRAQPLRERPVSLQMLALYRSGRQADALRAFERYRNAVGEELGIEPSPELQLLEEQVLLHDSRLVPPSVLDHAEPRPVVEAANPFKGLQAFSEDDVGRFFGREKLVGDLLQRIASGGRLLALVGASGSGKSSALKAGLVPAIRKGAVPGSEDWLVAQMVPGARPFAEAEAALLRSSLDTPDSLHEILRDGEDGLLRACLRLLPDPTNRVLLVIDQFEELFTLVPSDEERDRFIRNLEVVLNDPHGRVVVALALRADFYAKPLEYARFAQLLSEGIVNTGPLTPDELEAAAERPAANAGVRLEPSLAVMLLTDVAGQAGGLPLFQYALTELFERRSGDLLTAAAYHDMGGVKGALARRAEDLFLELDPSERSVAKQVFLRFVTITGDSTWGRRRVLGSELVGFADDIVAMQTVLQRFGAHRLLTFDRDSVTSSPTVEVAHEALLHEWPRLREWIDEGRDDVRRHALLTASIAEWEGSGEKPDYLLSGQRLQDYEDWAATSSLELSALERRYLDQSIRVREAARQAEGERQAREETLQRRARTRLWSLVGVVALAVAATALLIFREPLFSPVGQAVATAQDYQRAALRGDIDAIRPIFAPDATFWYLSGNLDRDAFLENRLHEAAFRAAKGSEYSDFTCSASERDSTIRVTCEYTDNTYMGQVVGIPPVPLNVTMDFGPEGLVTYFAETVEAVGHNYEDVYWQYALWLERYHPDGLDLCCDWVDAEDAAAAGVAERNYIDEYAAFLEEHGCTYDILCGELTELAREKNRP